MGLLATKPVFGGLGTQRRRPACALAQSDQHLYYSHIGKYHIRTSFEWNFNFLASLWSWEDWFECRFVGNPKTGFLTARPIYYSLKICFGCIKEPSHWDGSFEYPQHMFFWELRKTKSLMWLLLKWQPDFGMHNYFGLFVKFEHLLLLCY